MGAAAFEDEDQSTDAQKRKLTTTIFADTMEAMCAGLPVIYYAYCVLIACGLLEFTSADMPDGTGSTSTDASQPCVGPVPAPRPSNTHKKVDKDAAWQKFIDTPIKIDLTGLDTANSAILSAPVSRTEMTPLQQIELDRQTLAMIEDLDTKIDTIDTELLKETLPAPKRKRLEAKHAFLMVKYQKITSTSQ